jgi:hypothetical protein
MSRSRTEPSQFPGNVVEEGSPLGFEWNTRTQALQAASAVAPEFTVPQTILASVSATTARWVFPTNGARQIGLMFFGRGSDNEWMEAAIRGWRAFNWGARGASLPNPGVQFGPVWRPTELAVIECQAGAYVVPADADLKRDPLTSGGETNVRGMDVGTVREDFTYDDSTKFVGEETAGCGYFVIDTMGNSHIEIEARVAALNAGNALTSMNGFHFRM